VEEILGIAHPYSIIDARYIGPPVARENMKLIVIMGAEHKILVGWATMHLAPPIIDLCVR